MWLFFFFFLKKKKDNKVKSKGTNKKATTTTNKSLSYNIIRWGEGGGSCQYCLGLMKGVGGAGRTTKTNMAVSFTVYSSTPETLYKAIRFCLLGLSFHSSHRSGVSKHKSHLCVSVSENSREAWFGWMNRGGVNFYTLQKHILYSCCQWNKMSSLQDPWCWWW